MARFYNTLSGGIDNFESIKPGEVKLYTCGPTVYDYAHIGNFRAYIFEDLLKRFLMFSGYKVIHVMNITDVEDKIILGAKAEGNSLQDYTQKYITSFFEDLKILNLIEADFYPRATEHIPEMVTIIKKLLATGYAYKKDGSVYFDISKFPDYGKLSKIDLSELKSSARVDTDEYEKENVHDFALWKNKKENEFFWETEIGKGRPGWHMECTAMSTKYLGETFDIHCGGVDNIFPHHENEIAQTQAYTGRKFVNYWLHCHHLIVDGEKMSKSKGNQFTLKNLLDKGHEPASIRLLLISTHYRKMLNFTFEALSQSKSSLQRLKDFIYELKHRPFRSGKNQQLNSLLNKTEERFKKGLEDDLNISVALTAVFEMIKKINILMEQGKVFSQDAEMALAAIKKFDQVFGILPEEKKLELSAEIIDLIEKRQEARKSKDFLTADKIRDDLLKQGIILEDTPDGVRWKISEPSKNF